jgi:hypothetical protein
VLAIGSDSGAVAAIIIELSGVRQLIAVGLAQVIPAWLMHAELDLPHNGSTLLTLVSDALQAGYSRAEMFGSNPALRLATQAINRGEIFAKALGSHGHVYQFQPESTSIQSGVSRLTTHGPEEVGVRTIKDHPDIEDLTYESTSVPAPCCDDIIS